MESIVILLLEKVFESIFFALFLICGKKLKEKKLLFIGIMIAEYLILKYFIKFNVYFQLAYTFMTFLTLKVLYREKAQITDIFLFMFASLIVIITSFICYIPVYIICNHNVTYFWYIIAIVVNRLILLAILYFGKNLINKAYVKFYSYWNRPKQINNPRIKSLTLRNISIIIFNLMFYIINIGMIFALAISIPK